MTGKQARVLFQALLVSASLAAATAQGTKNSTVVAKPTPSPSPATGAKTNLPAATQRKAGGDQGIDPCFKPASKTRKAGGEGALSCDGKPASSDMRKAGGQAQLLCTNEKGAVDTRKERKAGGDPDKAGSDAGVVIAIRPSNLNGDGKTAKSKTRKAGGDVGLDPCFKPADNKAHKAGGQGIVRPNCSSASKKGISGSTGGTTGLNGDGKTGLNGDGKPAKNNMRKVGGDVGIRPCVKPADKTHKAGGTTGFICDGAKPSAAKSRKAGGQGVVRPNCSSATKGISGSTGGAPKPDVPQTQVPK